MGRSFFAILVALTLAGSPIAHAEQPLAPPVNYVIGPQDVLAIAVFDQLDLGGKYTVEADGTFSFPLVGRVRAAGKTLREFEAELKKLLADGFFRDPQLAVSVESYRSQRIFVMGEVRNPGPVALTGDMTLIEGLARAGSALSSAAGEVVIVRQKGQKAAGPTLPGNDSAEVIEVSLKGLQTGSLSQNVQLQDGDTIFVPKAESIYVFGQVRSPGSYSIQRDTTVLQALSLAGGVTEGAAMNRLRIVRIINNKRTEVHVGEGDLVKAGDTIIVPERFF